MELLPSRKGWEQIAHDVLARAVEHPVDHHLRGGPAARIKNVRLITYQGAPRGAKDTHKEQLGQDLLASLKEYDA